jgi:hypothetical protein
MNSSTCGVIAILIERVRLRVQVQQRDQHQQGTGQRVQEEFEGRIHAIRAAPHADDDVHRNERGFEEHVEQQAVRRREHADHDAREDQERCHVLRHARGDHFPAGDHDDHRDERGQHDEPHRDAVHAEVVRDVEAFDPVGLLDELQRRRRCIEAGDERNRDDQPEHRTDERGVTRGHRVLIVAYREDQQAEDDRQPDRDTENRK